MRYWAYANNEVAGPFEIEKLRGLPNFGLSSLICPETLAGGEGNSWKEAAVYPAVKEALSRPPDPVQPRRPVIPDPLAMTMRGTLIEDLVIDGPVLKPPVSEAQPVPPPVPAIAPVPVQPRLPAAGSPPELDLRGDLIFEPMINVPAMRPPPPPPPPPPSPPSIVPAKAAVPVVLVPLKDMPAAGIPDRVPSRPEKNARREPDPQLEQLGQKIDQMGVVLASIADNQAQLLNRLNHLESVISEKGK